MAWVFEKEDIDLLYAKWTRLGWRTWVEEFRGEIDVEELIAETTKAARIDGRLLKWLLTWIIEYQDLINRRRLLRVLNKADSAVLGAVLDHAMERGADTNFVNVTRKCGRYNPHQFLFRGMEDNFTFLEQEKINTHMIYRKWGLYCGMVEIYEDAKSPRHEVLRNNPQLAIRALFGPTLRAEIVHCLSLHGTTAIKKVSDWIGYAYSGVYKEVDCMAKNGLLKRDGRVELTTRARRLLEVMQAS